MVDSEYSMDIYQSLSISIGSVMRNPEIIKFVLDHLKTKKNTSSNKQLIYSLMH